MPESKQRTVSAGYKRVVGDGSFGSEAAEVHLEWFIDDDNDSHTDLEFAQEMLCSARDIVLNQLRGSLSANVRRAVTRPIAPARTAATVPADDEESLPF
jgi:hypothetical protein